MTEELGARAARVRIAGMTGGKGKGRHSLGTSELLSRLVDDETRERISIGDIAAALDDRAFGVLILLMALPGLIPGPPGFGGVFGPAILFFAFQMLIGRNQPWLPGVLARRSFARKDLQRIIARARPSLRRFERLCRPRLEWATTGYMDLLTGFLVIIFSVAIMMPVPLTNFFPSAAVVIVAIGIIERDGLVVLIGLVAGLLASAAVFGIGATLLGGAMALFGQVAA